MWLVVLWTLIGLVFLVKALDVRKLYIRWRQMPLALMVACALGLLYLGTYSYSKSGTNTQGAASSEGTVSEPPAQDPESRTSSMPTWWVHDETDTDGDGIPDLWEKWTHGNPLVADSHLDRDDDGLTDLEEFWNQTDPRTADTDGDGFSDAFEVAHGMDPLVPEDFTPTEPDLDNNGVIDTWEGSGYIYGFEDSDGDGFDDTYAQSGLPNASDANFDVIVDVYTTRSAVLTWENEDANGDIVILPTTGTSVRLRLPFGADTGLKLLPAPEGIDLPSGELWKSRIRVVFDGRTGQNLSGNALVSPNGTIAHKVINVGSVIKRFSVTSPDRGFQPQALGDGDSDGPNADIKAGKFEVFHFDQYHDVGDAVGPFIITNTLGLASATYSWYSRYGDMNPATGRESWLTVRKVPSLPNEKIIVVTTAELDSQSGVSVTSVVERCVSRVFSAAFSTNNFSPHLGETINICITVPGCIHHTDSGWLEIEIVREVMGEIQHVASVDMDGSTSTGDRYLDTTALGGQTLSFEWDGIAQSGLGLADHPDTFIGPKGSFQRAMPAVVAGKPVPPPFYTLIVRLWDENKSIVLNEVYHQFYVPQVVEIQWNPMAIELFKSSLSYEFNEGGSCLLYTGFTGDDEALIESFRANLQAYFPADVNIRFTSTSPAYGSAFKKVHIKSDVKFTLNERNIKEYTFGHSIGFNSRNTRCDNEMECYTGSFFKTLMGTYKTYADGLGKEKALRYPMSHIPLSARTSLLAWARVAAHETGHGLGLVDPFYMNTDRDFANCHNPDNDDTKIMYRNMPTIIRFHDHLGEWNVLNHSYLRFILPKPSEL